MALNLKKSLVLGCSLVTLSQPLTANDLEIKAIDSEIQNFEKEFEALADFTAQVILIDLPILRPLKEQRHNEAIAIQNRARFAFERYRSLRQRLEASLVQKLNESWDQELPTVAEKLKGSDNSKVSLFDAFSHFKFFRGPYYPADYIESFEILDHITHTREEGQSPRFEYFSKFKSLGPEVLAGVFLSSFGIINLFLFSRSTPLTLGSSILSSGMFGLSAHLFWRSYRMANEDWHKSLVDFEKTAEAANQIFNLATAEKHFWDRLSENGVELPDFHESFYKVDDRSDWLALVTGQTDIHELSENLSETKRRVIDQILPKLSEILTEILAKPDLDRFSRIQIQDFSDTMMNFEFTKVKMLQDYIEGIIRVIKLSPNHMGEFIDRLNRLKRMNVPDLGLTVVAKSSSEFTPTFRPHIFFDGDEGSYFRDYIYPEIMIMNQDLFGLLDAYYRNGEPVRVSVDSKVKSPPIRLSEKARSSGQYIDGTKKFTFKVGSALSPHFDWKGYLVVKEPFKSDGVRDERKFRNNIIEEFHNDRCVTVMRRVTKIDPT